MTLTMKHSGKLRVAQGAAWVTFSDAASDATVRGGDHFLNAGQSLQIKAGQVLVIEALDAHVFSTLCLSGKIWRCEIES